LVQQALQDNLTIEMAAAKISSARALVGQYNAKLYPKVVNGFSESAKSLSFSPLSNYSLDIWGAKYSLYQSYHNNMLAQVFSKKAASMLIISEIVGSWIQVKYITAEQAIIAKEISLQNEIIKYQLHNFAKGHIADHDVLINKQKLAQEQLVLSENNKKIDILLHQLNYLVGKSPTKAYRLNKQGNIPNIAISRYCLSTQLLQDRPDIQAAWYEIIASHWQLQNKKLAKLPDFTISLDITKDTTTSLMSNWSVTFVKNIIYSLFDAGLQQEELLQAQAILRQKAINYTDVVFQAILDVTKQFRQESEQAKVLVWQTQQLNVAEIQYQNAIVKAKNDGLSQLAALYKLITVQEAKLSLLRQQQKLNLTRVDLYNAIGGNIIAKDNK